jgi:hypothetical protein
MLRINVHPQIKIPQMVPRIIVQTKIIRFVEKIKYFQNMRYSET